MKGTISVKSTVGEGSIFTVKLPLRHVLVSPSTTNISRTSREVLSILSQATSINGSLANGRNDSRRPLSTIVPVQSIEATSVKDHAPATEPAKTDEQGLLRPERAASSVKPSKEKKSNSKQEKAHDYSRL